MRPRRCRRGFWTSLSILHSLFVSLLSCISIPRHSAETYLPLFISSYSSYSLYASYFWLLSPFISISPFGAIKPLRSCILSLLPILSSALFHSSSLISYGIPCRLSLSLSLSLSLLCCFMSLSPFSWFCYRVGNSANRHYQIPHDRFHSCFWKIVKISNFHSRQCNSNIF